MAYSNSPRITVCVCTSGRAMAKACIEHLLTQSTPVQIVVVDNSDQGTFATGLFPHGAPSNIKFVHEPRPGNPIA